MKKPPSFASFFATVALVEAGAAVRRDRAQRFREADVAQHAARGRRFPSGRKIAFEAASSSGAVCSIQRETRAETGKPSPA